METLFNLIYSTPLLKEILVPPKITYNKGTLLRNYVRNSGLKKFHYSMLVIVVC